MIGLSYVLGWPFLIAVESIALYQQRPDLAFLGPVVYGVSWLLLGIGLWLGGPEAGQLIKRHCQRLLKRGDS